MQPRWSRIVLLCVLAYEAVGALFGGGLLVAAPDGSLMSMPVSMMHGIFRDFLIPGIILFELGVLNVVAFWALLRRKKLARLLVGLALSGLVIWFCVEMAILQAVHWLHAMWGLPVVVGDLAGLSLLYKSGSNQGKPV